MFSHLQCLVFLLVMLHFTSAVVPTYCSRNGGEILTSLNIMLHNAAHRTAPLRSLASGMKMQYKASPAILMMSPPNEYTMLTKFE